MQFEEANRLRENNRGRKCTHPNIDKEYYLGSSTGDYICTSCGATFLSRSDWQRTQGITSGDETQPKKIDGNK